MPRRRKHDVADDPVPLGYSSTVAPFFDDAFISYLADVLATALEVLDINDEEQEIPVNPPSSRRTRSRHRRRPTRQPPI